MTMRLVRGILRDVAALPGVRSAAISTDIPLLGNPIYVARFEGRPPPPPSEAPVLNYFAITPRFSKPWALRIVRRRVGAKSSA